MASIFTQIVEGSIPSFKVAENAHCFAFLDINPLVMGHTLVVPKLEVDKLFDLPVDVYAELFSFAQKLGIALEQTHECKRVGMTVIGLEVPHAHIHLLPINTMDDMNFFRPKLSLAKEEFEKEAIKIHEAFLQV